MDTDAAFCVRSCQQARVEVHVRGTDEHPVVEFTTKRRHGARRVVGFVELKRRLTEGLPSWK